MDSIQIGLINFNRKIRGKQIGLINFFDPLNSKEKVRDGTPIGLLNIGSRGSVFRLHYNELFPINLEYTTGNCLNCSYAIPTQMPYDDANKIFNQNALMLGFDPMKNTWGLGYGFEKILFNKVSMNPTPSNAKRLLSYGITFLHLNRSWSWDSEFNLVTRIHAEFGRRVMGIYFFGGISLNSFLLQNSSDISAYSIRTNMWDTGKIGGLSSFVWPGYSIGIQI